MQAGRSAGVRSGRGEVAGVGSQVTGPKGIPAAGSRLRRHAADPFSDAISLFRRPSISSSMPPEEAIRLAGSSSR